MWEEWERHEHKVQKTKKREKGVKAETHLEVLSDSDDGAREEKGRCVRCALPDESQRDKEINCQEKPVNPERQRREHVCI